MRKSVPLVRHCRRATVPALGALLTVLATPNHAPAELATARWQLTGMRLTAPGITTSSPDGRQVAGVVIEGQARTRRGLFPIERGTFRLTLTAFLPASPAPERPAGEWSVTGEWAITDRTTSPAVVAVADTSAPPPVSGRLVATARTACLWPLRGDVEAAGIMGNGQTFSGARGSFQGNTDGTASLVIQPGATGNQSPSQ